MISLFQYYRIAAAYLILLIHQTFWPGAGGAFTGVAVPLFAAMAGYLVVGDRGEGGEQVRGERGVKGMIDKKARRILLPYAIWAVIYFAANNLLMDVVIKGEPFVMPGVRGWLLGGVSVHLWFLPCLFVAFVLFGLVNVIKGWIVRCVAVLVLLTVGAASQLLPGETSATLSGFGRIYAGRLFLYFMIGVVMNIIIRGRGRMGIITVGVLLALVGVGNLAFGWWGGLAWQPMALTVGLVLLAVGVGEIRVPRWVNDIARATMGIYLVHALWVAAANFAAAKLGHPILPWYLGFPLTLVLYLLSYLSVKRLPKWMCG